jgi:Flp pilus assembly protein TadG
MVAFNSLPHIGCNMINRALRHFLRDDRGNVSAIFALTLLPVVGLIGMGVDYTRASKYKSVLDAVADSASLAAVTPAMLNQPDAASVAIATTLFNGQTASINGLGTVALTVTPVDNGLQRTVTVSYSTSSKNLFGGFIGLSTVPISGRSTATASVAPNIDFYLMLDDSPSMAIPATSAGIATMIASTASQPSSAQSCAFACHEGDANTSSFPSIDNYQIARNLGVTLRMDLVTQAVSNLMSTAQSTATITNATYRAAIYTFDTAFNNITNGISSLSTAQAKANANISLYEVAYQNQNNDTFTDWTDNITAMNQAMPNPGTGTNQAGDTPQEVLLIVTDGVEDQTVSGNRVQSLMNPSYCTTIKNRGIRIAVLYTQYLPLPSNAWYNQYIAPFQPNIGPNLQSCASPGLYTMVSTDGDISGAMITLFNTALATAHLTQ